jgi:lysyl-tRNA synthetase class 2
MLERARRYFARQNVLAVDTPALSRYAISDPNIDSLEIRTPGGTGQYLHTSPEVCMKRLLASGYPDIYSICRVFRAGESGKRHQREFTLAEWYRLGFDLDSIIDDTIQFIAECLNSPTLAANVVSYEYREAIGQFAGVDIYDAPHNELLAVCQADARLKAELGEDRQAVLDLIMSTIVATQFARGRLTVVRHYPVSQAALARLCPNDARVADRFEIFYGDLELANGYVELNDPVEQRQRIDRDLQARQQAGRAGLPADETLLAALESGLPECAGVAVGMERLHMVLDQTDDIADVVTFGSENS